METCAEAVDFIRVVQEAVDVQLVIFFGVRLPDDTEHSEQANDSDSSQRAHVE